MLNLEYYPTEIILAPGACSWSICSWSISFWSIISGQNLPEAFCFGGHPNFSHRHYNFYCVLYQNSISLLKTKAQTKVSTTYAQKDTIKNDCLFGPSVEFSICCCGLYFIRMLFTRIQSPTYCYLFIINSEPYNFLTMIDHMIPGHQIW